MDDKARKAVGRVAQHDQDGCSQGHTDVAQAVNAKEPKAMSAKDCSVLMSRTMPTPSKPRMFMPHCIAQQMDSATSIQSYG